MITIYGEYWAKPDMWILPSRNVHPAEEVGLASL
jgi:hypothetical protein